MGKPRGWTISRVLVATYGVGKGRGEDRIVGAPLASGESIPVIEAVLTDELVLAAAKRIGRDVNGFPWSIFNDEGRERFKRQARAALLAAGFQEEGRDDG